MLSKLLMAAEPIQLSACSHTDIPPWTWTNGNEIIGVCAEITQSLFEQLGAKVDLSYTGPWRRCQENIKRGRIDVNVCIVRNKEREEYSEFMQTPVTYVEIALFVKSGREFPFTDREDLIGKKVGLILGQSVGQGLDDFLTKNTEVERTPTFEQNFKKLAAGRIDAVVFDRLVGTAVVESLGLTTEVVALPTPISKSGRYISMSRKSRYLHLLPEIDKLILGEGHDERVKSLSKKYMQVFAEDRQHKTSQIDRIEPANNSE